MSHRFCHNCGKQQPILDAKFCVGCGTSLSSLSSKPTPPPQPDRSQQLARPAWAHNDDDDDDEYIDRIQRLDVRINALEVEISRPPQVQGEKLGAIAAKQPTVDTTEFRQGGFANLTPEQVKEQFAKEAGSRVAGSKTHTITVDEK